MLTGTPPKGECGRVVEQPEPLHALESNAGTSVLAHSRSNAVLLLHSQPYCLNVPPKSAAEAPPCIRGEVHAVCSANSAVDKMCGRCARIQRISISKCRAGANLSGPS